MNTIMFKYFRDPENFSFRVKEPSKCSICGCQGIWFSAGGFSGVNEISAICPTCMADGALEELEIYTNEAIGGRVEETITIMHKTPSLPTWQDFQWPCVDGEYCIFERMASKEDFESKSEFGKALLDNDKTDTEWLWESMPEKKIRNQVEGNFNVSVYLFTNNGKKHCVWDAS